MLTTTQSNGGAAGHRHKNSVEGKIYVEMSGRLGNQFFRYAAARALQLKYYPDDELEMNFQKINDTNKHDKTFYNVLDDFKVTDYTIYQRGGKVIFNETSLLQKLVCIPYYIGLRKTKDMDEEVAYEKRWLNILQKNGLYWFRRGGWRFQKSKVKNKFLSGNFEDPIFFEEIREVLIQEFTPRHELLDKNKEFMKLIQSTNSVCMSVRRGNFESVPEIKKRQSVCDREYFENAIEEIKKNVENPVFFMFSDEIEWVRENIKLDCPVYYEDGTDPVWEKLRLMSACKHFIISNSTFSWWVQYLSMYEHKIVVSPCRWFNSAYKSPLIDSKWILIEV